MQFASSVESTAIAQSSCYCNSSKIRKNCVAILSRSFSRIRYHTQLYNECMKSYVHCSIRTCDDPIMQKINHTKQANGPHMDLALL